MTIRYRPPAETDHHRGFRARCANINIVSPVYTNESLFEMSLLANVLKEKFIPTKLEEKYFRFPLQEWTVHVIEPA